MKCEPNWELIIALLRDYARDNKKLKNLIDRNNRKEMAIKRELRKADIVNQLSENAKRWLNEDKPLNEKVVVLLDKHWKNILSGKEVKEKAHFTTNSLYSDSIIIRFNSEYIDNIKVKVGGKIIYNGKDYDKYIEQVVKYEHQRNGLTAVRKS